MCACACVHVMGDVVQLELEGGESLISVSFLGLYLSPKHTGEEGEEGEGGRCRGRRAGRVEAQEGKEGACVCALNATCPTPLPPNLPHPPTHTC